MRIVIAALTFILTTQALAQSKTKNELSITIENDAAFETDKYYSNGVEIMYKRKFYHSDALSKLRLGITHKIYTPEATLDTEVVEGDHPYTGILYGTLGYSYVSQNYFIRTDLLAGKQGPDAKGGPLQNLFHKITPSTQVNGWKNQTGNQVFYNGDIKIIKINRGQVFELSPWIRGRFGGLIDDAEVGLKFGMHLGAFEFFVNGSTVANFYNSILQGPKTGESVYVIAKEDMRDLYYQANTGFHLIFKYFRLSLKVNWYSSQFVGAKDHTYATLETAFSF